MTTWAGEADGAVIVHQAVQVDLMRPARDRMLELKYAVEQLGDVYDSEGIEIWLHSPQQKLEAKAAANCLREGKFERVLQAAEFLAGVAKN